VFLATGLVVPASLLVFLPISMIAGVVSAITLEAIVVAVLLATSVAIDVDDTTLRCGKAKIERKFIGTVSGFDGQQATAELGVRLNARAWLLIRGWIPGVVRVELTDAEDPTPYWLVSTRHPAELVAALTT
jgi:hypothetical protein